MKNTALSVLRDLLNKGIISDEQYIRIKDYQEKKPFSVHGELRTILYLGILCLVSGLGVIIYDHIDTIGHQVMIAVIALISAVGFFYAYKCSPPFSPGKPAHADAFAGFALLLACSMFLVLEGYLQFQYSLFGTRYGLAAFVPMVVFFFCAYRFDHKGVLSMAVTSLASWLRLTIAPLSIVSENNFTDNRLIVTAIVLGMVLSLIALLSERKKLKQHFAFTYLLLGGNLGSAAALTGLLSTDKMLFYILPATAFPVFFVIRARMTHSLIFLLMGVIYGYMVFTHLTIRLLPAFLFRSIEIYYFLFSSIGVVLFLLRYKIILGKNEKSIQ